MSLTQHKPIGLSLKDLFKSVVHISRIQKTKRDVDVPLLYREPHIHTGYRVTNNKYTYYLASLFQIHNETFNVWSHLLAAVLFGYIIISYGQQLDFINDERTWPLVGFAIGTVCYALSSSFAHLFQSQSELAHYTCFQIDYIGISMNALGNSILYYHLIGTESFYHLVGPNFFKVNIILSVFTCVGSAIAKLRYKRPYPAQRKILQLFAVLLESVYGSIPVFHKIITCLLDSTCPISDVSPHIQCFVWITVSVLFYSSHIPERLSPGRFDIIGYGHQIFHVTMAYTTCLQFRAAMWELKKRPRYLFDMSKPTGWSVFGALVFVFAVNVLFVIFTHKERVKRAKIALSDFYNADRSLQNGNVIENSKER